MIIIRYIIVVVQHVSILRMMLEYIITVIYHSIVYNRTIGRSAIVEVMSDL